MTSTTRAGGNDDGGRRPLADGRYFVVLPIPGCSGARRFEATDAEEVLDIFRREEPDGRRGWAHDTVKGCNLRLTDLRPEGAFNNYTVTVPGRGRRFVDDLADVADDLDHPAITVWDTRRSRWLGRTELAALDVPHVRRTDPSAKAATDTDHVFGVIQEFPGIPSADVAKKTKLKQNRVYRILGDLEKAGRIKKSKGKFEAVAEEK